MKTTYFRGLSFLVLASLFLAACGGNVPATSAATQPSVATQASEATTVPATESPAQAPVSGGTLTVGIPIEPETLDPGDAVYVQEQFILQSIFELAAYHRQGWQPASRSCQRLGTE